MKKIKLFFLAFLGVCLGLTSFSIAGSFTIPINYSGSLFSSAPTLHFSVPVVSSFDTTAPVSYSICVDTDSYNFGSYSNDLFNISMNGNYLKNGSLSYRYVTSVSINSLIRNSNCYNSTIYQPEGFFNYYNDVSDNVFYEVVFNLYRNSFFETSQSFSGNITFTFDKISFDNNLSVDCSQDSNYLQCLEDKNQLIGQVSTLSGSLSSCQSDLSDCRGGQDASLLACIDQKEQCESSLTTLSGNYASLENMNSSLSSQLQECLENSSGSGDLICNKFDLFRSSDNTDYSFPINNDLILPPGYKGFVNEGVLAIKQDSSLESSYSIDDEDFQGIVSDFGKVFIFIFSGGLFVLFLFIIRKYFTSLFK